MEFSLKSSNILQTQLSAPFLPASKPTADFFSHFDNLFSHYKQKIERPFSQKEVRAIFYFYYLVGESANEPLQINTVDYLAEAFMDPERVPPHLDPPNSPSNNLQLDGSRCFYLPPYKVDASSPCFELPVDEVISKAKLGLRRERETRRTNSHFFEPKTEPKRQIGDSEWRTKFANKNPK